MDTGCRGRQTTPSPASPDRSVYASKVKAALSNPADRGHRLIVIRREELSSHEKLTLFVIGGHCREYHYDKPLVTFHADESGQTQYVTTASRMIIPGSYGRSYEVSMSPSTDIFEMHVGQQQGYQQQHAEHQAYQQQQQQQHQSASQVQAQQVQPQAQYAGHQAGYTQQNVAHSGYQYQNTPNAAPARPAYAPQSHAQAHQGLAAANPQQNGFNQAPAQPQFANSGPAYPQQNGFGQAPAAYAAPQPQQLQQVAPSQPQYQLNNGPQASFAQQAQAQAPVSAPASSGFRDQQPNQLLDEQKHQSILAQARSHLVPDPENGKYNYAPPPPKMLRNRRYFQYTENEIEAYPYDK
uniref:Uncharacterized protein n=1 Tax=Stomoxys calcitrans TaxID=35570 RepID=A0A1I8P645_STOCA